MLDFPQVLRASQSTCTLSLPLAVIHQKEETGKRPLHNQWQHLNYSCRMFHLFLQFCAWFPVKQEQIKKGQVINNKMYIAPHI